MSEASIEHCAYCTEPQYACICHLDTEEYIDQILRLRFENKELKETLRRIIDHNAAQREKAFNLLKIANASAEKWLDKYSKSEKASRNEK